MNVKTRGMDTENLKLILSDYGPIRHADINLDGITLIMGGPGCGKKILVEMFHTLITLLNDYEPCVVDYLIDWLRPVYENLSCIYVEMGENLKENSLFSDLKISSKLYAQKDWLDAIEKAEIIFRNKYDAEQLLSISGDNKVRAQTDYIYKSKKRLFELLGKTSPKQFKPAEMFDALRILIHEIFIRAHEYEIKFSTRPFYKTKAEDFSLLPLKMELYEGDRLLIDIPNEFILKPEGVNRSFYCDDYRHWDQWPLWRSGKYIYEKLFSTQKGKGVYEPELMRTIETLQRGSLIYRGGKMQENETIGFAYKHQNGYVYNIFEAPIEIRFFLLCQILLKKRMLHSGTVFCLCDIEAYLPSTFIADIARIIVLLYKKVGVRTIIAGHNPVLEEELINVSREENIIDSLSVYYAEEAKMPFTYDFKQKELP